MFGIEQIQHHIKPRRNYLAKDKLKSNIVEHTALTSNYIVVSNIVKKINVLEPRYLLMLNAGYLSICEMDEYGKKGAIATKNKLIKIDYENKPYILFFDFCDNIKNSKTALLILMESYKFLLKSIQLLNASKICHMNISRQNIYLDGNCNFHPVIGEFHLSLQTDQIVKADTIFKANQYLNQVLTEINMTFERNYHTYPVDVCILYYIYQHSISIFTLDTLEHVHDAYIKNLELSGMVFYSHQQKCDFFNEVYQFLMRYIDQPSKYVVRELIKNINTWDNYCLGFEYILLLQNISAKFQLKISFMDGFFAVLIQTIAPNPHERGSINNTAEMYNRLFNDSIEWSINS